MLFMLACYREMLGGMMVGSIVKKGLNEKVDKNSYFKMFKIFSRNYLDVNVLE